MGGRFAALRRRGLDATALKTFAVATMLIDHTTFTFLERTVSPLTGGMTASSAWTWYILDRVGRGIGRQAFPIFAFFIAEGYCRTHSRIRYLGRLALFAAISQLPFWLMCNTGPIGSTRSVDLNVYATLALGLLAVWALDELYLRPAGLGNGYFLTPGMQRAAGDRQGSAVRGRADAGGGPRVRYAPGAESGGNCGRAPSAAALALRAIAAAAAAAGICLLAWFLHTDYDYAGVLAIVLFYLLRRYPKTAVLAVWVLLGCSSSWLEWFSLPGLLLLLTYNGERGGADRGRLGKYGFYLFYPVHLLVLWALRVLLCGA